MHLALQPLDLTQSGAREEAIKALAILDKSPEHTHLAELIARTLADHYLSVEPTQLSDPDEKTAPALSAFTRRNIRDGLRRLLAPTHSALERPTSNYGLEDREMAYRVNKAV